MAKFFTLRALTYHEISFFGEKQIVDTTNVDRWSPTLTFFEWSRVQKDTLFKARNSHFNCIQWLRPETLQTIPCWEARSI